ncbi:MAG: cobalt ECF transporter T component CbiQ [Myxococcales bacterium]|nr:MAG: cobalt ECF transporter T component CbiQ [Myxococcales bacterium]
MPDLAQLDPRARVGALLVFAIAVVALHRIEIAAAAFVAAGLVALLLRLPPATALRRLLAAQASLLLLLVTRPFSIPGEPLFHVGPFVASEAGCLRAATIALKANAIVLAAMALLGTLDASRVGHALHRLHAPASLVHLFLFTVRYLGRLEEEFARLRNAMRARAFRPHSDRHTWRSLGQLAGMLLVRSAARAERVMQAMRCRAFTGRLHVLDDLRWRAADGVVAAIFGLGLAGLVALDRW